ncbi:tRNA pseudouridine(55) synthase TruB [PVC group bacterium]|nr:tRNA pseudouridine(55) synthase TruB [PVC group bacterium]
MCEKPYIAGVLAIDKPRGPTSMSMVNLVRRRSGGVKTGHAGTLDPLATGVLVLGLGKMTKRLGELTLTNKRYKTVIDLSAKTAGHDEESPRVEVEVSNPPTSEEVVKVLEKFHGTILQRPPIFSAVKVDGHRAYAVARKGKEVVVEPREVEVFGIELMSYEWPIVTLDIACAKGFYVRSLARDLGEKLGTGGYCREIRRTEVGPFTLEHARVLENLPEVITQDLLISCSGVDQMLESVGANNKSSTNSSQ